MQNIAGIFDNKIDAENATVELLNAGFEREDISLLMSDKARDSIFSSTDSEGERIAKGSAAGAAFGGAIGILIGGLSAVSAVAIPGIGLLAAGPIVAMLTGLGAGATVGGLSGALIQAGFDAVDAGRYADEVKAGKAVIIVHPEDETQKELALDVLRSYAAVTKAA